MKKCPYCAEEIQDEAIVCRYCHSRLDGEAPTPTPVQPVQPVQQPVQPAAPAQPQTINISLGGVDIKKYIGIILNLVAAIGLFFPCFVIPAFNTLSSTYYGINTNMNPLTPISFVSVFETAKSLERFFSGQSLIVIRLSFSIVYTVFGAFEIMAIIKCILSLRQNQNIVSSYKHSRDSIMFLACIYLVSLISVIVYNISVDKIYSSLYSGDYAANATKIIKMDFPVVSVIFFVVSILIAVLLDRTISQIKNSTAQ